MTNPNQSDVSLTPEIKAFLAAGADAGLPQVWEAPLDVIRRNTHARIKNSGPAEPVHQIINRFIPGKTADLPIRIYRPTENPNAPAIVFFHGGGWVLSTLDIFDSSLSRLANQSGATIISVFYQKAPEHPFPIPFDDCYESLLWVLANAEELKIDPTKVGVMGDSAGGNLASAVALKARDNGVKLALQVLIYPCNERNFETHSYIDYATGYLLTTQGMKWFWEQYVQNPADNTNPYAAPMHAKTFKDLAPAVIVTAQYDPLLADSEKYAKLLQADGVPVVYKQFDGMIHGFFVMMAITKVAAESIDFIAQEIKKLTN
jgi:acetyl esterase